MTDVDRNQPALVGGLLTGVLSVIPIVQSANLCCCLWAIVGGATAAKLLIDRSPQPVVITDSLKVGALAGLLGGVIRLFIGLPIELATMPMMMRMLENLAAGANNPKLQELAQTMLAQVQGLNTAQLLVNLLPSAIIGALLLFAFTIGGALLGWLICEKRKGRPAPPDHEEG